MRITSTLQRYFKSVWRKFRPFATSKSRIMHLYKYSLLFFPNRNLGRAVLCIAGLAVISSLANVTESQCSLYSRKLCVEIQLSVHYMGWAWPPRVLNPESMVHECVFFHSPLHIHYTWKDCTLEGCDAW